MGGSAGRCKFDLKSGPIKTKSIRNAMSSSYSDCIKFWGPKLKVAHEQQLVSFYTDIGKDKVNNRAMVNICATITFPALPDITFDLSLCTRSYDSALMAAAAAGRDVSLNEIADEVTDDISNPFSEYFYMSVRYIQRTTSTFLQLSNKF